MLLRLFILCLSFCNLTVQAKDGWDSFEELRLSYLKKKEGPRFVFIIPSYNNADWYKGNLDSVFTQMYTNWRIIYIDDASSDQTADLVEAYVKKSNMGHKVTLIKNKERKGIAANRYTAIHMCDDDDIIVALDGDDKIASPNTLSLLHSYYTRKGAWATFGQYKTFPGFITGCCRDFPNHVKRNNTYRSVSWRTSHLKTFYAWLAKRVKEEDFKCDGTWIPRATDRALMLPIIEMAGEKAMFVEEVTYIYNRANVLNVSKTKTKDYAAYVHKLPAYERLLEAPKKMKRGCL